MVCSEQDGYARSRLALVHLDLSDTTDTGLTGISDPFPRMESLANLIRLSSLLTTFVATGIDISKLEALDADMPWPLSL